MANAKILKKYLVDENNGYLLNDNNNGKVIMLSGKWGSGKTYFWKNDIATDELKKELSIKNSAYSYVSLYGKSSIEEIENDIFGQIYFSAIDGENLVTKTFSTFTKYSKRYGNLFSSFDFSKLAEGLEEEQKNNKERVAFQRLKNSAIICFDDFERKSKDIDLNDLFGFITNLTIEFNCKVVIILNDDIFEGEEKKIFSNVKEKSVSKFLKYEPSIKELFNLIFYERDKNNKKKFKYLKLRKYRKNILNTIKETKELNARIYIQVLDNLVEWIGNEKETNDDVLRCLILVNINFILYHQIYYFDDSNENFILPISFKKFDNFPIKALSFFNTGFHNFKEMTIKCEVIDLLKNSVKASYDNKTSNSITKATESLPKELEQIENHGEKFWLYVYFEHNLNFRRNISSEQLIKINNFIETGILINE